LKLLASAYCSTPFKRVRPPTSSSHLSSVSGLEGVFPERLAAIGGPQVTRALPNVARASIYARLGMEGAGMAGV
jgi:hypothetical protein